MIPDNCHPSELPAAQWIPACAGMTWCVVCYQEFGISRMRDYTPFVIARERSDRGDPVL